MNEEIEENQLLTPTDRVIKIFGGVNQVAQALGCDQSTVSCWRGRSGGRIPSCWHRPLIEAAAGRGLTLLPSDVIEH